MKLNVCHFFKNKSDLQQNYGTKLLKNKKKGKLNQIKKTV